MSRKKKFDIESIIGKCSVSRPLCFEEDGVEIKADYNLEVYCELLRERCEELQPSGDPFKDKNEFENAYAIDIDDLLDNQDYWDKKNSYTKKELEEEEQKEKERYHKELYRYHNRIIKGMEGESNKVASDKKCYHFLRKIETRYKKQILIPIRDDVPYYHENMYIFTLIVQLIGIMNTSELYNYVPNSSNYQRDCFCNHMKFIEDNIALIFIEDDECPVKWGEILRPFKQMIYEGSYPGIHENDIWFRYCNDLRFFDCSYEIAKNYKSYSRIKNRLAFDLGNTQADVMKEVNLCKAFFDKNQKPEKELFCEVMLNTLNEIARKEFRLEV